MKKNEEILKKFKFELEIGVFKKIDSSNLIIFYVDEDDDNYFSKFCILFDILKELNYKHVLPISSGVIYDCTVSTLHINTTSKTFYTSDEDINFIRDNISEIPEYLQDWCIIRKEGMELFDYELWPYSNY